MEKLELFNEKTEEEARWEETVLVDLINALQ